jgi:hypothetical protein
MSVVEEQGPKASELIQEIFCGERLSASTEIGARVEGCHLSCYGSTRTRAIRMREEVEETGQMLLHLYPKCIIRVLK